jgi:putative ABC transport system ATP-binding protein
MTATATAALAACLDVSVRYGDPPNEVTALRGVDLELAPREALALRGRSGSGKTTLLHVLGGLVAPTDGAVQWRGELLSSLDRDARAAIRSREIAYVFQGANLLAHFTALENVAFAAHVAANDADPRELLDLVGLARRSDALPGELSGGEAQRVALARALAQGAQLLLCDEPTGQLDSDTGERVLDLIEALHSEHELTVVCATHDPLVAGRFARVVELADGQIVGDGLER